MDDMNIPKVDHIQLTEAEFDEKFLPLDVGESSILEWDELQSIVGDFPEKDVRPHLWTYVEGDDGSLYIIDGPHFVNRVGYLVTEHPAVDMTNYEIKVC